MALTLVLVSLFVIVPDAAQAATQELTPATLTVSPGTLTGSVADIRVSDNVRASVAEADVTAGLDLTRWLKPTSASGVISWTPYNDPTCSDPDDLSQWRCVDDDPLTDGNSSIVVATGTTALVRFGVQDFSGPYDVTFDSLTAFAWGRRNTTDPTWDITIWWSSTQECNRVTQAPTPVFANYSSAETAFCGPGGGAWTSAQINDSFAGMRRQAASGPAITVTAAGLVAQYDDRDYQTVATITFTGVEGGSPTVFWEGSRVGTETFSLQVQRPGPVWDTICSDCFETTEGTAAQAAFDGSNTIIDGTVTFRIIDNDLSDDVQSTLSLDWVGLSVITAAGDTGGVGGPPAGPPGQPPFLGLPFLDDLLEKLPEELQVASRAACNLWLFVFLALAIVVGLAIRRSKRKGPSP